LPLSLSKWKFTLFASKHWSLQVDNKFCGLAIDVTAMDMHVASLTTSSFDVEFGQGNNTFNENLQDNWV
jgi:hypothetical protein